MRFTAGVLTSLLLATPGFAAQVNLSGLQSAETHQAFIVKYRDAEVATSAARSSVLSRSLAAAVKGMPVRNGRVDLRTYRWR